MTTKMSDAYRKYVDSLGSELSRLYAVSESARQKGLDPSLKVESIIAQDIADLVEGWWVQRAWRLASAN